MKHCWAEGICGSPVSLVPGPASDLLVHGEGVLGGFPDSQWERKEVIKLAIKAIADDSRLL